MGAMSMMRPLLRIRQGWAIVASPQLALAKRRELGGRQQLAQPSVHQVVLAPQLSAQLHDLTRHYAKSGHQSGDRSEYRDCLLRSDH